MYEDLFWALATGLATALPVYLMLIMVLDWCRSILFYNR